MRADACGTCARRNHRRRSLRARTMPISRVQSSHLSTSTPWLMFVEHYWVGSALPPPSRSSPSFIGISSLHPLTALALSSSPEKDNNINKHKTHHRVNIINAHRSMYNNSGMYVCMCLSPRNSSLPTSVNWNAILGSPAAPLARAQQRNRPYTYLPRTQHPQTDSIIVSYS